MDDRLALRLISMLYDAAEDPGLWPATLDAIGATLQATAKVFSTEDVREHSSGIALAVGLDPSYTKLYNEHYESTNLHLKRARPLFTPGRVVATHQVCSDKETLASEYYNDFLRPQANWFHVIGACLAAEDRLLSVVHFMRARKHGAFGPPEFEILELLVPHFQRAVRLHSSFSRQRRSSSLMDSLPIGLAVLDGSGKIEYMNHAAEHVFSQQDGFSVRSEGKLTSSNPQLEVMIGEVSRTAQTRGFGAGGVVLVPRASGRAPYTVHVSPIRQSDPLSARVKARAAIFITDPDSKRVSIPDILRQRYDATKAEARIGQLLCDGLSLTEVCQLLEIRYTTARTHLQHLFDKVGVSRQAELVSLLLNISSAVPNS